ncbi:Os11g0186525, partial [Oryza sativa Japonica Group]
DAPGHLELPRRAAAGDVVAEHLLERPAPQHPQLERPDGARLPRLGVPRVGAERPVHLVAAPLQHAAAVLLTATVQLPEDDVVARVRRRVGVAGVVGDLELLVVLAVAGEDLGGAVDGELEVVLAVLVDVDGQDEASPAHEPELGRRVVESGHLHHVAQPVAVQAGERGHDDLVVLADDDVRQADGVGVVGVDVARRAGGGRVVVVGGGVGAGRLEGDELEVGGVGQHGEHDGLGRRVLLRVDADDPL